MGKSQSREESSTERCFHKSSRLSLSDPKTPKEVDKRASQPTGDAAQMPNCLKTTNVSSTRFRKSCYFEATCRYGVRGFTPYNHMLLPVGFASGEDEYACLKEHVCLWDVAVQRQIELVGEDALKLAEMMTPRALGSMKVGECRYAIITDDEGMVLNDPIALKLAEDRFWFSIADGDLLLFAKGLAIGKGLNVRVAEIAVSPLAVQGPKSTALMQDLFGDWVLDLKYYNFRETELDGIPMLLARSGWSPERGYELYLQDDSRGDELWERVMQAGQKYSIMPGAPNQIRRIEGGMLSYGADMTNENNALELPLPPKWVAGDKAADFAGKAALQRIASEGGPRRKIVGLELLPGSGGGPIPIEPLVKKLKVFSGAQNDVGELTSWCFSPGMNANIGIATLAIEVVEPGTEVHVELAEGKLQGALVRALPFLKRTT